jgi:hypothetical protein
MSSRPSTGLFGGRRAAPRAARAALVALDEPTAHILADCFKQFKISTEMVSADAIGRFNREKFDACVLRLDDKAEAILCALRESRSNRSAVVFGLAATTRDGLRFSKFGINALLPDPLDRATALKVVRATHLLVVHELRRYVRLPVVTEVVVETGGASLAAASLEISQGGMSLRAAFTLPNGLRINISAVVCWRKEREHSFGIRFTPQDPSRAAVKNWVDEYLEQH